MGVVKSTTKDVRTFAASKNGKFLSSRHFNGTKLHTWQCLRDHQWQATFKEAQKSWCPICLSRADFYSHINKPGVKKKRSCLKCGRKFYSTGNQNRCCGTCASRNAKIPKLLLEAPLHINLLNNH